jgi:hypothetical protein
MVNRILDNLSIGAGVARSISLERDLYSTDALGHYLVTPAAIAALNQVGFSFKNKSAQRAWKIVGPYGSGKSALGLVAGQLFAGKKHFEQVASKVEAESPETFALFQDCNRYPIAVVGSRVSFGAALARELTFSLSQWKNKPSALFRRRLADDNSTYDGVPINAAVSAMASDFADAAIAADFSGVVFLVDELGKFVEHAALHPEEGDLMALQQLAELACAQSDDRIAVIAMLHQHLSSYGGNVGRALSDEWEKVASRFEEIPFDEPVERYAHFAAHTLGVHEGVQRNKELRSTARSLYADALELGELRAHSQSDTKLFATAEALYPLHPAVIASSAIIAKRLGQSERSFHAFLRGDEPFALRQFATENEVSPSKWYRLSDLYDNLATGHGIRFRDRNAERRWAFAVSCVDREKPGSIASDILKAVAVLDLVQASLRLAMTPALLHHALDSHGPAELDAALEKLVERGVLFHLRDKTEYALAVAEIANVEALFEAAAAEDESKLIVRALTTALASRSTVANRHYDRTGTLRTMGVVVGTPDAWPQPPKPSADEIAPDGWLKLVVVTAGSKEVKASEERFRVDHDELTVNACLPVRPEGRRALVEYATWLAVQHQLNVKHLDPWANQYAEQRLQEAREAVGRLLATQLSTTAGRAHVHYWHQGALVEGGNSMNLSRLASSLFDKQFGLAPKLVNELINKDKPPSAITLARQRMFEVLLGGDDTKRISAANEYPPERLIQWSLLEQTGILTGTDGERWKLQEPTDDAPVSIRPIWDYISKLLQPGSPVTFETLLEKLAEPPFGVRAAPAGVWIAMYLIVRRHTCALFERGTLQLELTAEHLMRMYKTPGLFEVRELTDSDENRKLISNYRTALASVGCSVEGATTHIELTRSLYRWLARLPEFVKVTGKLSKDVLAVRMQLFRSQDQIELLTKTLPQLHLTAKCKQPFGTWLAACLAELGSAQRKLQDDVSNVLGTSFEIAGSLGRVRTQLQRECSAAANDLGEQHLKAFVLRCADPTLTDERWLDSIASLVVHRPLDTWTDATLANFETAVADLCAQYKRWIRAMSQRARNPAIGERWVSLTMTLPGGQESAVFVVANDKAKLMANEMLAKLQASTGKDRDLMIATLGQALLQCQTEAEAENEAKGEKLDNK